MCIVMNSMLYLYTMLHFKNDLCVVLKYLMKEMMQIFLFKSVYFIITMF